MNVFFFSVSLLPAPPSYCYTSLTEKDLKTKCVVEMEGNQTILNPSMGSMGKGDTRYALECCCWTVYVDLCVTTTTFGSGTQVTFYQESSLTHQTDSCDKARRQRYNAGLALKTVSREGLRQQGITAWQG